MNPKRFEAHDVEAIAEGVTKTATDVARMMVIDVIGRNVVIPQKLGQSIPAALPIRVHFILTVDVAFRDLLLFYSYVLFLIYYRHREGRVATLVGWTNTLG